VWREQRPDRSVVRHAVLLSKRLWHLESESNWCRASGIEYLPPSYHPAHTKFTKFWMIFYEGIDFWLSARTAFGQHPETTSFASFRSSTRQMTKDLRGVFYHPDLSKVGV